MAVEDAMGGVAGIVELELGDGRPQFEISFGSRNMWSSCDIDMPQCKDSFMNLNLKKWNAKILLFTGLNLCNHVEK